MIFFCDLFILPKIILEGAHTSTISFLNPLITQWYLNLSTESHFCLDAILSQFFLRAAVFHPVFEVGQAVTISTLSTASLQYRFPNIYIYYRKFRVYERHCKVTTFKDNVNFMYECTWFCSKTRTRTMISLSIVFFNPEMIEKTNFKNLIV